VQTALLVICGVIYGLAALLLMGGVLLQESKGGGLAALGGTRAESAFGASNPLRRITVVLSIIFFLLASVLALALTPKGSVAEKELPEGGKQPGVETTVDVEEKGKKPEEKEKEPAGKQPEKDGTGGKENKGPAAG